MLSFFYVPTTPAVAVNIDKIIKRKVENQKETENKIEQLIKTNEEIKNELQNFSKEELDSLKEVLTKANEGISCYFNNGISETQNKYN